MGICLFEPPSAQSGYLGRVLVAAPGKTDHHDLVGLPRSREFHGFGHGMGLCQWGAQGQALAGRNAVEILKFYYPEAHLTRAY